MGILLFSEAAEVRFFVRAERVRSFSHPAVILRQSLGHRLSVSVGSFGFFVWAFEADAP